MEDVKRTDNLRKTFHLYREVKLVYLFGSRANGKSGPLSDYDFGIYLDEKDPRKRFDLRLKLISEVSKELKEDRIDICILNDIDGPELKYNIIKNGKLIFEEKPFKILVEPKILNEYFDFHLSLLKYNLTKG